MGVIGSSPRWPYSTYTRRKERSFMPYTQWAAWGAWGDNPPEQVQKKVYRELDPYHTRIAPVVTPAVRCLVVIDQETIMVVDNYRKACEYCFERFGKPNHYAAKPNPEG